MGQFFYTSNENGFINVNNIRCLDIEELEFHMKTLEAKQFFWNGMAFLMGIYGIGLGIKLIFENFTKE